MQKILKYWIAAALLAAAVFAFVGPRYAHAGGYTDVNKVYAPPFAQAGSNGSDFSVNVPSLPNIGAGFGATGPYANYVLVQTIPADPTRLSVDIENNSGAQIAIVRDDGTALSGAAPVNGSVFALGQGQGAGSQGGSFVSQTFKGRLQIYAPSPSAQVAIFVD